MKPIKITIVGSGPETDAPTVDDLLGQLRDVVELMRDLERAVAEPGENIEIEWRVTDARRSSPLAIEVTPFPKHYGMNITRRDESIRQKASAGLSSLLFGADRPAYFNDQIVKRAEHIYERVTANLNATQIDFGVDLPPIIISPQNARIAIGNAVRLQKPEEKPYREFGSVEGYPSSVERDGLGRPLLWMRVRLNGDNIKCVLRGAALAEIGRRQVRDIIEAGNRVLVRGLIYYRTPGKISSIDADSLEFLRRSGLPQIEDIINKEFTGGKRSEDYLEEVRSGKPS